MIEETRCVKLIYRGSGLGRGTQCERTGKVQRDGKWYCGIHDPVAKKERQDKRYSQWREERAEIDKARAAAQRRTEAGEMGIELARYILGGYILDLPGAIVDKAQAIIDALGEHS